MSNVEELEELQDGPHKEVRTPWVPRVIQGGKGPPEGPVENWVAELEVGTTFVAQPKSSSGEMNLYCVRFKSLPEVILLAWRLPDGNILDMYFNPEGFCRLHGTYKILGTQPVSNEENENDERDNIQSSDLVLCETVQGVDQVVPEPE